jgi:GAF domain-containing protein
LGDVIAASDPSYQQALRGRCVCGNPRHGLAERLIAERLQHEAPITSVASAPILVGEKLVALLELGRTDHAFRADDADDLAEFAKHVAGRLAQ